MNYYKRHIGDYLKDTAHLSLLEHGVYTRLLDVYYTREAAIPADQAYRLIGARSKEEREAVDRVLDEFFARCDDVYTQARCEREISASQDRAEKNREVGKKGGRPKKNENPKITQTVSEMKPINNPNGFRNETQIEPTNNPSHKPLASISPLREEIKTNSGEKKHTEVLPPAEILPPGDSVPVLPENPPASPKKNHTAVVESPSPTTAGLVGKALVESGIPPTKINLGHPLLVELLRAGATVDEFRQTALECAAKQKSDFAYVLGTMRRRREEAANLVLHQGRLPGKQEALERRNKSAVEDWVPPELREQP